MKITLKESKPDFQPLEVIIRIESQEEYDMLESIFESEMETVSHNSCIYEFAKNVLNVIGSKPTK